MTDATPPRVFIGIQPCRVADTRGNGAPIQGGIFANGEVRTWSLMGVCGIPAGVEAISANFTVTGSPDGAFPSRMERTEKDFMRRGVARANRGF